MKITYKLLRYSGVYVLLLGMTIILLYPVLLGKATFFIIGDNIHLAYASIDKLCISLHKGYFPTWDANCFGGRNFPGGIQTGVFYPLGILWCYAFGSVSGIDVYYVDLLVGLHYFICMIGMYQLAKQFKLSPIASISAALTFTFSGVLATRSGCETYIFYGLALMPWVIYFVAKYYCVRSKTKYLIYAGLIGGLQILAGHMQPFFHTVFIAAIIIIYYEYERRKTWLNFALKLFWNLTIIFAFASILAFPQLYYAAEYLPISVREVSDATYLEPTKRVPLQVFVYRYILKPTDYTNFIGAKSILPDDWNFLYMGILGLLLALFYLIKRKFLTSYPIHIQLTKILIITGTVGIFATLGYLTFFPYILYFVPFVNGVRELSRYVIMISFAGALLVGLALTYLKEIADCLISSTLTFKFYILLALTTNALYWVIFQQKNIPLNTSIPFLFGFGFFSLMVAVKYNYTISRFALVLIFLDLFLNPVNFLPSDYILYPTKYYAKNRIYDFLETTYGKYRVTFDMESYPLFRRNLGDVFNIQIKRGYDATLNKSFFDFINFDSIPEIDDLLNVKYVITDKTLDSTFIFRDSVSGLKLYQRRTFYPRCYWKHQLGEPGLTIEEANENRIRELTYSDLYQKWKVTCESPDTLIFSENMYPGWSCYDNQKKIPIYTPAIKNYPKLFRGIALGKGEHMIEFRYKQAFGWF